MDINVIIGPPCAGKSTYIKENATQGDVLIDYDAMAMALGAGSTHTASGAVREVALRLRYSAINKILEGISAPAWIIHTNPRQSLIDDYAEAGAVFTIVDPGKAVCLERAEKDYRPEGTVEVIEAWYESPPNIPQQSPNMDIGPANPEFAAILRETNEARAMIEELRQAKIKRCLDNHSWKFGTDRYDDESIYDWLSTNYAKDTN